MKILVTGAVGFIGFHVVEKLLKKKINVVGLDNFNNYYDPKLKKARFNQLKKINRKLIFYKVDLNNYNKINKIFKKHKFDYVVNLAAQAGVRHSISNPDVYFSSNVLGFYNLLKCSTKYKIKHLVGASSSSVYGEQSNSSHEDNNTNKPLQFYAATKKSNEVMAHSFSNIYNLPVTMLRLFTVYGPWGRPDMSLFKFTNAIINKKKIYLYNKGKHFRDYTYIDDIVNGILFSLKKIPKNKKFLKIPYQVYNLGNGKTIYLKTFLKELEIQLNQKTKIIYLGKQKGDIFKTNANITKARKMLGYKPKTNYKRGISKFLKWYNYWYQKK